MKRPLPEKTMGKPEEGRKQPMTLLTAKIKEHALALGADLVGVANIGRYEKAPLMMN